MKKDLLTLSDLSTLIEDDVYGWLDPISCIKRRNCSGGTGPEMVKRALTRAKEELTSQKTLFPRQDRTESSAPRGPFGK